MSTNFSYSKLDTYVQCGFKYKLVYVDNHYLWSNSIATEFGTLIHETEEAIARSIQAGQAINYIQLKNKFILKMVELENKYPQNWSELDKSGRTYKQKAFEYLEKGIYRLETYMNEHPTYEIVGIEQKFEVPYSDKYHFKGFIDRVFHDKTSDTYLIQDIKSWAIPAEHKDLTTPLQFVFYTIAAKSLYNCTEDQISCQYDLPLCYLTQDAGTKGYMSRGIEKINKLFNGIESGEFKPNPTALCHWCNFCPTNPNQPLGGKNLCPYYCKWTRENPTFEKEFKWDGPENHQKIMEEYRNEIRIQGGEI